MLKTLLRATAVLCSLAALVLCVYAPAAAAGGSWTVQPVSGGMPTDQFHGLSMVSNTDGFVVGGQQTAGAPYRLTAGTWTAGTGTSAFPTGTPFAYDVSAIGSSHAWAVGNNASIEFWNGTSWAAETSGQPTNGSITLRAVKFINPAPGVYQGIAVGTGGTIIYSPDGTNWFDKSYSTVVPAPVKWTTNNLRDVYFLNDGHGATVGVNGTILYSLNFGQTWSTPVSNPAAAVPGTTLYGVDFVTDSLGFAVGTTGAPNAPTRSWILRTTDGGQNWTDVTPAGLALNLSAVSFPDANNGWVVGNDASFNAVVLSTSNGSALSPAWTQQTVAAAVAQPFGSALFDVQFTDACHGWTVGANQTALTFTCPAPPVPSPTPTPTPSQGPGLPATGHPGSGPAVPSQLPIPMMLALAVLAGNATIAWRARFRA